MSGRRVLVFTESALALSETFIADHCRALRQYQPTLVALYKSGDHHGDVPRHLLYEPDPPVQLARLAFRLGFSRRLDAKIKEIKPDLIHAHYLTNGAFLLPYAKRHGLPLVVTAHGHDATRRLKPGSTYDQIFRYKRHRLDQSGSTILPVSRYLQQILLGTGFSQDHLRTHHLGIPLPLTPAMSVGTSPPHIAFVGRLVEKKGIDTVLDAFAQVRAARPSAQLHVVGDGPMRPLVEAARVRVGGIVLHGAQPPATTQRIMASARLLALPSRKARDGDVEGFGLVLIEAQAMGIPVVTSDASGTAEAIIPGKTGFGVDPANSAELAAAFLKLIDDPDLARTMGLAGQHFVRSHFDITQQTRILEAHYDQALAAHHTSRPAK